MNPDFAATDPGHLPRLFAAAAFLTDRATEASLAELRLTQERAAVLELLAAGPAGEAALAEVSGLAPECVHDCLLALQCCGYAVAGPEGQWCITGAGTKIRRQAAEASDRLLAGGNDLALRRELSALIRALSPAPGGTDRT